MDNQENVTAIYDAILDDYYAEDMVMAARAGKASWATVAHEVAK